MKNTMTTGNLTKQLITFTIPLILSGLLQQLYSWVDAFIVGNFVGEHALAAIGVTSSITNMLIMIMTGFVSGVSILSAQYYGKSNTAIQKNIISTFLCVLGVCFTLLALCSIFFANTLLELLNTPTDIFEDSISYLRIILLGIPFLCVYNTYASVLRGIGNSKVPFYSILVSGIANHGSITCFFCWKFGITKFFKWFWYFYGCCNQYSLSY